MIFRDNSNVITNMNIVQNTMLAKINQLNEYFEIIK